MARKYQAPKFPKTAPPEVAVDRPLGHPRTKVERHWSLLWAAAERSDHHGPGLTIVCPRCRGRVVYCEACDVLLSHLCPGPDKKISV